MSKPRVLYWFRTDLRLHDSPALKAALDLNPECLYPIWTWDPHYVYRARVGPNRWKFLLDCQNDLSASLSALNAKQRLLVIREAPQTLFPKLFGEWNITHLVFEEDTDAYARDRDAAVTKQAHEAGVVIISCCGRTLYNPEKLVAANGGKPTMTIAQVQKAGEKLGDIPRPIPAPSSLPDPGDLSISFPQERPSAYPDVNAKQRDRDECSYRSISGPNRDFAVPTMDELGLSPATTPHRGGESVALHSLEAILKDRKYTATFSKPATAPTDFCPQSTTLLSPHLHFGSLGIRRFYWGVQDVISTYKGPPSATTPPTSLLGQLLFRDMYFGAQAALGHAFARTLHNPTARFIPWSLNPSTPGEPADPLASTYLLRWREGQTGFPFVDALMRQLRLEGWIHHLGRHMVACFLTRGGCYISWEVGAQAFEEWLIDHEVACNSGNWQWLSCTSFFHQYRRVYSPVTFPRKWDPEGKFVKRFVPELASYPSRYIYEPWKAPIDVQRRAGCLIKEYEATPEGKGEQKENNLVSYPTPMFDFAARRAFCMERMKEAYQVGLYGDSPKLVDGSWKELFTSTSQAEMESKGKKRSRENIGNQDDRSKKPKGNKKLQTTLDAHVRNSGEASTTKFT